MHNDSANLRYHESTCFEKNVKIWPYENNPLYTTQYFFVTVCSFKSAIYNNDQFSAKLLDWLKFYVLVKKKKGTIICLWSAQYRISVQPAVLSISGFVLARPKTAQGNMTDYQTTYYHVLGSSTKNVKVFTRRPLESAPKMEFLRKKRFIVKVQLPIGKYSY